MLWGSYRQILQPTIWKRAYSLSLVASFYPLTRQTLFPISQLLSLLCLFKSLNLGLSNAWQGCCCWVRQHHCLPAPVFRISFPEIFRWRANLLLLWLHLKRTNPIASFGQPAHTVIPIHFNIGLHLSNTKPTFYIVKPSLWKQSLRTVISKWISRILIPVDHRPFQPTIQHWIRSSLYHSSTCNDIQCKSFTVRIPLLFPSALINLAKAVSAGFIAALL